MAYVQDDPNQQQPATAQNAPGAQAAVQTSSGGGGAANTGSPQGASAVPNSSKAPPVQNLQAYLSANAPQATGMGQNIAKQLGEGANAVNTDIQNAQAQFEGQVNASAPPANSGDIVNQAAANPAGFVQDPNNVANFQKVQNANYTGPTSFEGSDYYANLNQEVQNAQQNAPDVSNPANIQQLVRGQERNPTTGKSNLDSLLLQQSPEGIADIKAASAPYANLGTSLKDLAASQDKKIADTQAATASAKGLIPAAFNTGPNAVIPTWENALNQEVQSAAGSYAKQGSDINNLTQGINAGDLSKLTPDQLSQLGLTADQAAQLMTANTAVGKFGAVPNFATAYTPGTLNPNAPTAANIATSQDYATQAALEQLLGSGFGNAPLNDAQSNLAGTYSPTGTKAAFDPGAYSTNLANTFIKNTPNTGGWTSALGGQDLPTNLAYLESVANIGGTQNPGQYDYASPQQIAVIKALESLQGSGYLPANKGPVFPGFNGKLPTGGQ